MKTVSKMIALVAVSAFLMGGFFINTVRADLAVLGVTQITAVQTFASADNTFANGWKWVFNVTVPEGQTLLNMKFADWVNGSSVIPADGNIRFYSAQSTSAFDEAHALGITASGAYSNLMYLNSSSDLDVNQGGRQIQIVVQARIPEGSAGGSYSTSYGINTTAPATIILDGLNQTYNATPRPVTVTTDPTGLATRVTYDGSETAPTHAGTYTVNVTVTNSGYTATSTAILTINPASVSATAEPKTKVYDGLTATDPKLTYIVAPNLFGDDSFTGTITRQQGEDVRSYSISQGTIALNGDYVLTFNPSTFSITPASAIITLDGLNQTYDKTVKSAVATTNPAGLSMDVTYNGSPNFPVNAGTYAVTATIKDPNYEGFAKDDIVIAPASLTVTAASDTKTYDGNISSDGLPAITSGTLFSTDSSVWSQVFDTKNAGTDKALVPAGTISDNNNGNNYAVTFTRNATGSITPAVVTVTATGKNKTYDGTTSATVDLEVVGAMSGDSMMAIGTAVFDGAGVGTHNISVTGITISGPDVKASDYTYNKTTGATANITSASLTITANNTSKIYGNKLEFFGEFTSSGLVSGDSVTSVALSSTGADENSGVAESPYAIVAINAVGTGIINYAINYVDGNLTVTPKNLVSTITANGKTYDGNTDAVVTKCSLNGVTNNDNVICKATKGIFDSRNVGVGKTVTANITLTGDDKGNYTVGSPATALSNIDALPITITAVTDTKIYDGMISSDKMSSITSNNKLVGGDTAIFAQTFNSKDAGTDKILTPSIIITDDEDRDTSGRNYSVTSDNVSGFITIRDLIVKASGINKIYDGTTVATVILSDSRVPGDVLDVGYTRADFGNPNMGTGKSVSVSGISIKGVDARNYNLTNLTTDTIADVSAKLLTITANNTPKIYGYKPDFSGNEFTSSGLVLGDSVASVALSSTGAGEKSRVAESPYAIVASSAVGTPSLSNYDIRYVDGSLTVNPKMLNGEIIASDKTYDGTTSASVTCSLVGIINSDEVTCTTSNSRFGTRNAGTSEVFVDLTLLGADSRNYSVNPTATTRAVISKLVITVTAQPNTKVYDGITSSATMPTFTSYAAGDSPSFIEMYLTSDAGIDKILRASGMVVDGNNGLNYDYRFIDSKEGLIQKANQTVEFLTYPNGEITGNSFNVTSNSSSGLAVTFAGGNPDVCSVASDGTVSLLGSGQCTVVAKQNGDNNFNPADNVTKIFLIAYRAVVYHVE